MLVNLQTILQDAEKNSYAVPAFNVYNMETVMGVIQAAEEQRAPVIIQFYSRLATTEVSDYLAPIVLKAAEKASVPVCMHLDHGAGYEAAAIALKNGATGIMVDFSKLDMDENIANTKKAVDILSVMNIGVEGEIGHIGAAAEFFIPFISTLQGSNVVAFSSTLSYGGEVTSTTETPRCFRISRIFGAGFVLCHTIKFEVSNL